MKETSVILCGGVRVEVVAFPRVAITKDLAEAKRSRLAAIEVITFQEHACHRLDHMRVVTKCPLRPIPSDMCRRDRACTRSHCSE